MSCVEARRWRYTSDSFAAGKSASSRTRSAKMERVHSSLKSRGGHDANQSAVWNEVEATLRSVNKQSSTLALSDAYSARQAEMSGFRTGFSLPGDAVGLAVFYGPRMCGLDLFDRHESLRHYFETLADSYAIDWIGLENPTRRCRITGSQRWRRRNRRESCRRRRQGRGRRSLPRAKAKISAWKTIATAVRHGSGKTWWYICKCSPRQRRRNDVKSAVRMTEIRNPNDESPRE